MNGGETIINRIKADCDESVASIRLDAEKANAAVLTEAEREAQLREKEIADKTQQRLRQIQAASKSRAELEVRNALLRRRRSEIDKTVGMLIDYLLQLGDNDYFNAIYKLAARLRGKSGELMLNQRICRDFPPTLRQKSERRDLTPPSPATPRTSPAALFSKAATSRRIWTSRRFSARGAMRSRI